MIQVVLTKEYICSVCLHANAKKESEALISYIRLQAAYRTKSLLDKFYTRQLALKYAHRWLFLARRKIERRKLAIWRWRCLSLHTSLQHLQSQADGRLHQLATWKWLLYHNRHKQLLSNCFDSWRAALKIKQLTESRIESESSLKNIICAQNTEMDNIRGRLDQLRELNKRLIQNPHSKGVIRLAVYGIGKSSSTILILLAYSISIQSGY